VSQESRGLGARGICVLGMPRSGTSLITRVLNIMGVALGPEQHMLEPTASNPKGYWEQREINALNDAILSVFGGSFEHPPDLPPGWQHDPALDPLRTRAAALVTEYFADAPLWGFKDPRNSITHQFWRELVPGMAAVLCVRAPEDVASSWQRHDRGVHDLDWDELLGVWLHYNSAALQGTSGAPRVVVSHERFLAEPREELRRLAAFLTAIGVPPNPSTVGEAARAVDGQLVHHHTDPLESLRDERVPAATRALYEMLLDLAAGEESEALDTRAAELWRSYASPGASPRPAPPRAREASPALDWPPHGAALNRNDVWVWGRAAFPDAATARVLVAVDGAPPMRAKLAVPREDTPDRNEGFELLVPPRALPAAVDEVGIAVTVTSTDGTTVDLGSRHVRLEPPQRGTDQNDGRARSLRERVVTAATRLQPRDDLILAVAPALERPGMRQTLLDLLSRLSRRGYEVTLAASVDRSLRQRFEGGGTRVHSGATVPLESPETYEARLAELAGWLATEGVGAIVAAGIDSFPLIDLAQRLGVPNVWLLHETVDPEVMWIRRGLAGPEYEYARERACMALRETRAAVFPSRAGVDLYQPYDARKHASIVPTPIDAEGVERFRSAVDRAEIRAALGVPADATLMFSPRGGTQVLSAVAEVRKRHPHAHFIADASGFHLFEAADVVVVDEDPEDLPVACLQAMAFETPVVASRSAGAGELIDDGVDGWLYETNDVGQLIGHLQRALEMAPDERRGMGARAARRVKDRHTPDALAETVQQLLTASPMLHAPCRGSPRASTAPY